MAAPFIFIGTHRVKESKFDDFKKLLQAFCKEVVEGQEPRLLAFNGTATGTAPR